MQKPLTSIISLPEAKIRKPADLKGKTVGTAGIDYQSRLPADDPGRGRGCPRDSVKERNVGFSLTPALLTGKVDAVLGAFWNYEGTELRLQGKRPRIIRMEEAGVPTYNELVLVANEDALERDGDKIRAFIGALSRGTRDLREDPDEAIEGLLEANPDLDPELQRAVVEGDAAAVPRPGGQAVRLAGPEEWDAFAAWMQDKQLLENPPDVRAAVRQRAAARLRAMTRRGRARPS